MKRKLDLATPITRDDGMSQTKVELDYVYIHEDKLTVYTKQGNAVTLAINPVLQDFVDKLEDKVKAKLENP